MWSGKIQFLFDDGFQLIVESHHVLFCKSFECVAIAFCGVQGFVKMCEFMGNIDKKFLRKIFTLQRVNKYHDIYIFLYCFANNTEIKVDL